MKIVNRGNVVLYLDKELVKRTYPFVSTISIVETIRGLVSPSLGGISSVPIAIFFTLRSFRKRFLVISAASTAVVIACPLAFKVNASASFDEKPVIIAIT